MAEKYANTGLHWTSSPAAKQPVAQEGGNVDGIVTGTAGSNALLPGAGKGVYQPYKPSVPAAPGGGGGGAQPVGAGAGGTTNTAQNNPDIAFASAALKERYSGDNGAGRAIDLAMGKLRDSAEGERRAATGRRAARGVSGTGVDSYDEGRISDNLQRTQAGAASDIAQGAEQAKTGLLSTLIGAGSAQGNLSLSERNLALQQYQAQQQNEFEKAAAARAQELAILQMLQAA